LYPDDDDEQENNEKISEDGLSIKSSEDQKKDTCFVRFIDLTSENLNENQDSPKKILKKRSFQERENLEDIESSDCSIELVKKRKPGHSFVPNIS
jgi:hypothetical protein